METYSLDLHCHNCGEVREYTLQKGVRVAQADCENCGIKQLKRVEYAVAKKIEERLKDELREEMGIE